MKKKITIISIVSVAVIVSIVCGYSYFGYERYRKEFKACQVWNLDEGKSCTSDDECTFFSLGCGGIPVNKKTLSFMEEHKQQCLSFIPQVSCMRDKNDTIIQVPRCKIGRCFSEERE